MIFSWQLTTAAGILSLTTAALYIQHKHSSLEAEINRGTVSDTEREKARREGTLQTVPAVQFNHHDGPRTLHERCAIILPTYSISDRSAEHFTKLLRHNMSSFARFPQAWIFWLMLPEKRHTFASSFIDSLDFREGDLVCGLYKVVKRSPTSVELSMEAPQSFGGIGGLLVVRLEATSGEQVALITETLQWTTGGEPKNLPLSKPIPRFLHEIASASLLVSGAKFLGSLDNA